MSNEKPRLLIVHGTKGYPEENWFPWLRQQAVRQGWLVDVPRLPTPMGQDLAAWRQEFQRQCGAIENYHVAVGHSLGTCFILRMLESGSGHLPLFISVAGCIGLTGIQEFDELNQSFVSHPFGWTSIAGSIGQSFVIYSDDDPYVPESQSLVLIDKLGARAQKMGHAGHINSAAGYTSLPPVLEVISSQMP